MGGYSQSIPGGGGGGSSSPAPSPIPAGGQDTASAGGGPSNPALRNALGMITSMGQMARQFATAYPQCAPEMRQIGDALQKCLQKATQAQQAPEPAVPPV